MTLKEQITADMTVFFDTDEFAQTITYNGTDIPALVEYGEDLDMEGGATGSLLARAIITLRVADVPAPAYRDEVVIGSMAWRVLTVDGGDDYTWRLNLFRDERPLWA